MKRVLAPALLVLAAATICPSAGADSGFRCPSGRLVSTGDHMREVRDKCGDPNGVTQRTEKRKIKVKVRRWLSPTEHEEISEEREIEVLLDEWTYDFGKERFIRHVTFEDARVVGVATGGYGTGSGS
jgi:uncharacterized protein DUF2845